MANEQSGTPLRRWRPFYGAFSAIDEAIEAAGHPRAAFRDTRVRILKLLRAATDDGVAEQLCAAHDDAMVEALETLRVVPVPHSALASTDLARTVGALKNHESARIRSLASDVVRGWKTANVSNVATATSVKEEPVMLSVDQITRQGIPTSVKKVVSKMEAKEPIAAQIEKMEAKKQPIVTQSEKMETTKRKLREGYHVAEEAKRQHTIKKIEDKLAPKLLERSQRKMHRAPARCRTSSGVRRSLLPSLQLV